MSKRKGSEGQSAATIGPAEGSNHYSVSGGKIIGKGAKILWDLSGVEPGTYTITAAIENGCGFCGRPMTKKVVVKYSPECNPK